MKLIVGLGNPGIEYESTRHNAGFIVCKQIINYFDNINTDHQFNGEVYYLRIENQKIAVLLPQTYMNLSGICVSKFMNYYKIKLEDLIIVQDEKDFATGRFGFKNGGSDAGHNGIKSLVKELGTNNFKRLRVGIDSPKSGFSIVNWVLSKFSSVELDLVKKNANETIHWVNDFINNYDANQLNNKYAMK